MPAKPPAPSDLADKFMLRLPDGMRDRIAEAARVNGRSMNAEIVARLEASFENAGEPFAPVISEMMSILDKLNNSLASDPMIRAEFEEALRNRR